MNTPTKPTKPYYCVPHMDSLSSVCTHRLLSQSISRPTTLAGVAASIPASDLGVKGCLFEPERTRCH